MGVVTNSWCLGGTEGGHIDAKGASPNLKMAQGIKGKNARLSPEVQNMVNMVLGSRLILSSVAYYQHTHSHTRTHTHTHTKPLPQSS